MSLMGKMAKSGTAKSSLAADCALLVIVSALSTSSPQDGGFRWSAVVLAAVSLALWLFGARVLRQYHETNGGPALSSSWKGQNVFNDLALASVLVIAVVAALLLLRLALPALLPFHASTFLVWLWLGVLASRALSAVVAGLGGDVREQVLIIGTGPLGQITGERIREHERGRTLWGYLGFEKQTAVARLPAPVIGTSERLEDVLKTTAIDEVYIAGNAVKQAEAMQTAIRTCEKFGIPFAIPAHGFRFNRARALHHRSHPDGYAHFVNVEPKPLQMMLKRLFDIAGSGVALWILSPLLLAVAVAIKVTSRGPVLFKQTRVGMYGRTFSMLKFRSMVVNAEALRHELAAHNEQQGPVFKMAHDPRITPVGRILRKFSIDELPQLINVLRGEMSIVGPRPPLPSEVVQYEPWQRRRLSVRPGLTCLWQVSGRNQIAFKEWMYLDMQYIDHWSLGQDFNLILKTLPAVLSGRGAS